MKTMKRVIPANEAKPRPSRDARMRTLVIPAEAKRRAGTHPPLSQGRTDRAAVRWGKTLTPSYSPTRRLALTGEGNLKLKACP